MKHLKNEIRTFSNTKQKNNLKFIKDLKHNNGYYQALENRSQTLFDINCNNIFFDSPPRIIKIKIKN